MSCEDGGFLHISCFHFPSAPQVEVSITREMPKVGKERKDEAEMKGTVYSRQINRS